MRLTSSLLLLGLLLLLLAPFAALAPLITIVFISAIGSLLWSLLRTLITGEPVSDSREPNRPSS